MNIRTKSNARIEFGKSRKTWIIIGTICITLVLCYVPLGFNISQYCIQSWDESRNVVNAIEMLKNHQWFVRHFDNSPDMWELKPPFLVWCQALAIHFFGLSELSVRLPSVFFSLCTVIFLMWVSRKITGQVISGCIASLILVSSQGYIGDHVARFGDHDVVLVFFFTLFVGLTYLYFKSFQSIYLIGLFVALLLGWFTKSIIIFMAIPGLAIWLLANNQLKVGLRDKRIWIGIAIVIGAIMGYYFYRQTFSPDYIHQVWMNELFGRYSDTSTNYHYQKNDFWYYWHGLVNGRFWPFIILFLVGSIIVILKRDFAHRRFLLFLALQCLVFFLILSAGTKNFWYDVPIYPMASLFIAIISVNLYQQLKYVLLKIASIGLSLLILIPAYTKSINYTINLDPNRDYPLQSLCYYLKDNIQHLPKEVRLVTSEHSTPLYFYREKAKEFGCNMEIVNVDDLGVKDTVLVNSPTLKDKINLKFITRTIETKKGCALICIESEK